MRLKALHLTDFQAHKETAIEFSPTITTLVGPTDVGKSAVLRALRWVCLNDIAGDEFIREGQKRTTVVLSIKDKEGKHEIQRVRGSGVNSYALDDEEYKAFGQSAVPSNIESLLRLNEINFQGQHDSPFWFNETAGEVSRRLNAVVDLSVIDSALAHIASEVRRTEEKENFIQERLDELKKEAEELEPQRARVEEFKSLKDAHDKFTDAEKNHRRLESVIGRIREGRDRFKDLNERAEEGRDLLTVAKEALDLAQRENRLRVLLQNIKVHQAVKAPPDFEPIEKAFDAWEELGESVGKLSLMIDKLKRAAVAVANAEEAAEIAERKFHQEIKGKACPLCQQIIEA